MGRAGQDYAGVLEQKIRQLKSRIAEAERRAGRQEGSTKILFATKYATAQQISALAQIEPRLIIGESRVQEAEEKFSILESILGKQKFSEIEKHMIGNLQSNKIKRAVRLFSCIQSVSSASMAEKISQHAQAYGKEIELFVEVNNGEKSKGGVPFDLAESICGKISCLPNVKLVGLMGMGMHSDKAATSAFYRLLKAKASSLGLQASMGMSDDFEIAVEAGSDMVRIGRAVFLDEGV
ncbi:MAG: YggS family pyridoxal phosphate-dependent enzyme [Candidatus Micrarchaeota archaeon]|nr:YggS family pyridoxal phosphate-dependent enzyme [Candidatus Micrarchaeota archaeon]